MAGKKGISLHPDLQSGFQHLFHVDESEHPEQAANIGKRCKYRNTAGIVAGDDFTIGCLQFNWQGVLCYRIYADDDTFGRIARLNEIEILEAG